MRYIHVVPFGGAWAIKKDGQDRAIKMSLTKAEAIKQARKIKGKSQLIIHLKSVL